jgi:AraC-like DNA-binding protein
MRQEGPGTPANDEVAMPSAEAAAPAPSRGNYRYGGFGRGPTVEVYGYSTDDAADPVLAEARIINPTYRRLSARPFRCSLVGVGRLGVHFELETFEGDVHGEVRIPPDLLMVVLPLEDRGTKFFGAPVVEHPMLVGPGTTSIGATPGGVSFMAVDFEGAEYDRLVAAAGVDVRNCRWLGPGHHSIDGPIGDELLVMLRDLAEAMRADPERLAEPRVFDQLHWDFTHLVQQAIGDDDPRARYTKSARHALAESARTWIERRSRSDGSPVALGDICAELGTSERTLQAVFAEQYNVGFREMERTFRLHAAREALLAGGAGSDSEQVTEVATRFGFWHLGRFSAYYRAMFGEAPSSTLRRSRMR